MIEINIHCPACQKNGAIKVEENIVKESMRGITAVNVGEFLVCKHSFIVYIDNNFAVRDSFVSDFKVELPDIKFHEETPKAGISFDTDIIKINLLPSQLIFILRSIFLKRKIVILSETDYLIKTFNAFLEYIISNQFIYDVFFISKKSYENNKKSYKDHLIIQGNKIIKGNRKLFDLKKNMIENVIIKKFFEEPDQESCLIIFKNEILKAREISNEIMNILNNYKGKNKMGKKDLITKLRENYQIKITLVYLEFVLDILNNYDNFDLSSLSNYFVPGFRV